MNKYKKSGWFNESQRHSLARKGIRTGRKINYAEIQKGLLGKKAELSKRLQTKEELLKSNLPGAIMEEINREVMGLSPALHQEEFWDEVNDMINDRIIEKIKSGELKNQGEIDEEIQEIGRDADGIIEDDENEPIMTVFYDYDETPYTVGYYHDNTEGDFEAEYIKTDAWRGYYEPRSDRWVNVHSDNILSYSQDEEELKKFDDGLREELSKHGIKYARVFSRTSNVFSTGYDFFVEKDNIIPAKAIAMKLSIKYRDPERYKLTALTGKSGGFTEDDKLLAKAYDKIKAGASFEDVSKDIIKKRK